MSETLTNQVQAKVAEAENAIMAVLQKFHSETGLVPRSISFDVLDVREHEDFGKRKRVLVSGVQLAANT